MRVPEGAINSKAAADLAGDGSNVIVITYDLIADSTVRPGTVPVNSASLSEFSANEGGTDFTSVGDEKAQWSDTATVTIATPSVDKSIINTSIAATGSGELNAGRVDLVVGEEVTYQVVICLGEGTTVTTLADNLPASLASGFLGVVSSRVVSIGGNATGGAVAGGNLTGSSLAVGASGVASNVNFSGDALHDRVVFNFGNILNTPDNVANGLDQIVVEIVARIENVGANTSGDSLVNRASLNYGNGTVAATAAIDVVEPQLDIQKTASPNNGDAGDIITYTLTLSHTAASQAAAYGLVITDILQSDIQLVAGSVTASAGSITTGNGGGDTAVRIDLATYTLGSAAVTITYQGQLRNTVVSGSNASGGGPIAVRMAMVGEGEGPRYIAPRFLAKARINRADLPVAGQRGRLHLPRTYVPAAQVIYQRIASWFDASLRAATRARI